MRKNAPKPFGSGPRNSRGYTLIEVLAAMVVFALGILSLYRLQTASVQSNLQSNMLSQATILADENMERLLAMPYASLLDTDGDGTNQDNTGPDGKPDGQDDDGGNFGLDDTGAAADGTIATIPNYLIYWNIAVNQTTTGTKTIQVIVTWTDKRGIPHRVVLNKQKMDVI